MLWMPSWCREASKSEADMNYYYCYYYYWCCCCCNRFEKFKHTFLRSFHTKRIHDYNVVRRCCSSFIIINGWCDFAILSNRILFVSVVGGTQIDAFDCCCIISLAYWHIQPTFGFFFLLFRFTYKIQQQKEM